jgi:hypothetical protein
MAARQTIRHLSCKRRGTGEQVWREGVCSWLSPEGEIQKKQKNVERKLSTSTMCGAAMRHRTSVQQHLDDAGHAWPTERWVESRQVHENASFDTSEVPCVGAAMQEPRVCEGVLCAWLATTCARGASTSAQHKPTDTPPPTAAVATTWVAGPTAPTACRPNLHSHTRAGPACKLEPLTTFTTQPHTPHPGAHVADERVQAQCLAMHALESTCSCESHGQGGLTHTASE